MSRPPVPRPAARSHPALWLGLLALLTAAALWFWPPAHTELSTAWTVLTGSDRAATRAWVGRFGLWGPLALVGAFVVQAVLPFIPSIVLIAAAGLAYGPLEGFFIIYLGVLLGACLGYLLGRGLGEPLLERLASPAARQRMERLVRERGMIGVLLVRLMPVLPAEVMNIVAGTFGLGFRRFLGASALGALPICLLLAWLSDSPQRLTVGGLTLSAVVGGGLLGRWLWLRRRSPKPGRSAP